MKDKQVWNIVNISLALVALILLLNLFGITLPTVGQAEYILDQEDPLCIVNWKDNYNSWSDLDSCCLEARKQLNCVEERGYYADKVVSWRCQTGELSYWLNDKAYNYCRQQNIW